MSDLVGLCIYLCRGHNSVPSPAEIWELLRVITKTYRSGIWRGAILYLKLQLVKSRKIVAWCWSRQGARKFKLKPGEIVTHKI